MNATSLLLLHALLSASASGGTVDRAFLPEVTCAVGLADGESLIVTTRQGLTRMAFPSGETLWHVPREINGCVLTLDESRDEVAVVSRGEGTLTTYGLDGSPRVEAGGLPPREARHLEWTGGSWAVKGGVGQRRWTYWLWPDGALHRSPRQIAFLFGERPSPAGQAPMDPHDWSIELDGADMVVRGADGNLYQRGPARYSRLGASWSADGALQLRVTPSGAGCEVLADPLGDPSRAFYPFSRVRDPSGRPLPVRGGDGRELEDPCPWQADTGASTQGLEIELERGALTWELPDDAGTHRVPVDYEVRAMTWHPDGRHLLVIGDRVIGVHEPAAGHHPGMEVQLRRRPSWDPLKGGERQAEGLTPWRATSGQEAPRCGPHRYGTLCTVERPDPGIRPVLDTGATRWPVVLPETLFLGGHDQQAWLYRTSGDQVIGGTIGRGVTASPALTASIREPPVSEHAESLGSHPPTTILRALLRVSQGSDGEVRTDPPDPQVVASATLRPDGSVELGSVEPVVVRAAEMPLYLAIRIENATEGAVFGVGPSVSAHVLGVWTGTAELVDLPPGATAEVPFLVAHAGAPAGTGALGMGIYRGSALVGELTLPVDIRPPSLHLARASIQGDELELELAGGGGRARVYGQDAVGHWQAGEARNLSPGQTSTLPLPPPEARRDLMVVVSQGRWWVHQLRVP